MSHSTRIEDDDGRVWVLIHNGDWSGDVEISRWGDAEPGDPNVLPIEKYTLPGAVIRQACASAVINDTITFLEQWNGTAVGVYVAIDAMRKAPPKRKAR